MTVGSNQPSAAYVESGVALGFAVPFRYRDPSDLVVSRVGLDGAVTMLTNGVHWTATAGNSDAGGTLTLVASIAGARLRIKRRTARTQQFDYTANDIFPAETHEAALDQLTMELQEQDVTIAEFGGRALLVPDGEAGVVFPGAAARANKYQAYDSLGNPLMAPEGGSATLLRAELLASAGSSLVFFLAAAAAAQARSLQDKLRDAVSVKDFGAVGDGVTDDRAAIAAAVLAARGKKLTFPEGNYLIDTAGGSIVLEEVALEGETPLDGANATLDQGANLQITGVTNGPFKVRRGVSINGIGFNYPNQPDSATPVVYPASLAFDFTNGAVQFVNISGNAVFNAYRFIDIDDAGAGNVGHVEILGNYICALNRGIYLSHNSEHVRIKRNNFTFGHWLAATEAGSRAYMRANATAIKIDKSDGVEVIDNLIFGNLNGVLTSATGLCQFMNISLNKLDQVRYPIKATGTGNFDGHIIGNVFNALNNANQALQGRSISIDTSGTALEGILIEGNSFDLATEEHIFVSGNAPTRNIVIGPNNYRTWAAWKAAGTFGAINVSGALTNLQVTGGWLNGTAFAGFAKGIVGSPNTLQVTGVTIQGTVAALDVTSNSVLLAGNRSFSTSGATSDIVAATTVWQSGNQWDKPSGTSTKPAFLASKSASQTFNSGVATDIVWGAETYDGGSNFATPSFTAPITGLYRFSYGLLHDNAGTAGDRWQIAIVAGADVRSQSYKMIADFNSVTGDALFRLSAGATVKMQITRVSGAGNFITFNSSQDNFFSGQFVEA